MNTLEYMGIQRWKKRNTDQVDVTSLADPEIESKIEGPTIIESSDAVNTEVKGIRHIERDESVPASEPVQGEAGQANSEDSSEKAVLANSGWQELADRIVGGSHCQSCAQTNPVLGDGNLNAEWVFVFDAPSAKDVNHQKLLSGRDGQLFDAILDVLSLDRNAIYLTSIFKCPPSQELDLAPQCGDLVHRQLQLIRPKVVIALGEFASQTVLRANEDLAQLRSQELRTIGEGSNVGANTVTKVAATYSLSQMLESPELKASVWQDLKKCLTLF